MEHFDELVQQGFIHPTQRGSPVDAKTIADSVCLSMAAKMSSLVDKAVEKVLHGLDQTRLNQPLRLERPSVGSPSSLGATILKDLPSEVLEAKALAMLQSLLKGPHLEWTCMQQRDAIVVALQHRTDVLAIIKTGWGKSMLPIIPAMMEDKRTTVIVLPLRSLMDDYCHKLQHMGVPFEHFHKDNLHLRGEHNLVLVSADYAKSSEYLQAIAIVNESRPVTRVCFDEGHFAYISDNFRQKALSQLYDLRQFPDVQLMVLSGTVPEISVPTLRECFGLVADTTIFRTKTSRPEIKYILEKPQSKSHVYARVEEIISQESTQFATRDRALVFVTYTEDGEEIAKRLQCQFYTGNESVSDKQRLAMSTAWRLGTQSVMVATSAFGTGNDHQHVRIVIHAGNPYDMLSYTQEKSRAGRDGNSAKSYILPRTLSPTTTLPVHSGPIDHGGISVMQRWLHGPNNKKCSRHIITAFCDGEEGAVTCSDDFRAQPCAVCESQHAASPSMKVTIGGSKRTSEPSHSSFSEAHTMVKRRKVDVTTTMNAYITQMKDALLLYIGQCALCTVLGAPSDHQHDILRCPSFKSTPYQCQNYLHWRRQLRYEVSVFHDNVCYKCHVPQMEYRLHGPYGWAPCEFPDIIAPTAFAIFCNHIDLAQLHFQARWADLNEFAKWLNAPPHKGSQSNITELFLWYHSGGTAQNR